MLCFYTVLIEDNDDKLKFQEIYTIYKKKMWYAANSVLSDSYLAEDAVHNAFLGIACNMSRIDEVNSKKTYAYVITAAKNAAIDILRKNKSDAVINIDELYNVSDSQSNSFYEKLETKDAVEKILSNIPQIYRDVLYLLIVEGMSEKEIASFLNRKPGTIHQQVRRGRKILEEELKKGAINYAE